VRTAQFTFELRFFRSARAAAHVLPPPCWIAALRLFAHAAGCSRPGSSSIGVKPAEGARDPPLRRRLAFSWGACEPALTGATFEELLVQCGTEVLWAGPASASSPCRNAEDYCSTRTRNHTRVLQRSLARYVGVALFIATLFHVHCGWRRRACLLPPLDALAVKATPTCRRS
jgi:hypothetical protein